MAFVSGFTGASLPLSIPPTNSQQCARASINTPPPPSASVSRRSLLSGAAASAAALALLPAFPALADHTKMAAERSYQRYYPRIEAGVEQIRAVREAIGAGDIMRAKELAAEKTFDVKLRRALSIYATSFSDSNVNEQSRKLLAAVDGFYGGIAKATNATSKEEAVEQYNKAASAFEAYVRVARINKLKDVTLTI